jgi:hypothetical protein
MRYIRADHDLLKLPITAIKSLEKSAKRNNRNLRPRGSRSHARILLAVFISLIATNGFGFEFVSLAGAQAGTAEISGTVRDATDAVVPAVTITVTNQASGQMRQVLTDSDGNYAVLLLPVGEYAIRAEFAGFNTLIRQGVVLQVGQKLQLDLKMDVGQISEQVSVEESAPLLDTSSAEVAEVIANQRLIGLPLNGRLFVNLTALSDNIVMEARGTRGAVLGQTGATFAVAGQRGGITFTGWTE